MNFSDRKEAGLLLAQRLEHYRDQHPIVLGIPRGGVPIAAVVAKRLDAEIDVILVARLGVPFQPELPFGSVDETAHISLSRLGEDLAQDQTLFETEKVTQLTLLRQRRMRYTGTRAPLRLSGRTVILVDDGCATGSTAVMAAQSVRARGARWVVVAVPVAPKESLALVEREADDVECLVVPPVFHGVREFYTQFAPVTDDEIVAALAAASPALQPSR
jgi:predicted phosphoribosyltransferase